MNQSIDQLTRALGVIATDPKIVSFLQANDPQALKQCQEALRNYFNQFEDNLTTSQLVDQTSAQYNNTTWLSGATTVGEWYMTQEKPQNLSNV